MVTIDCESKLVKQGNSHYIVINSAIVKALKLQLRQKIKFHIEIPNLEDQSRGRGNQNTAEGAEQ